MVQLLHGDLGDHRLGRDRGAVLLVGDLVDADEIDSRPRLAEVRERGRESGAKPPWIECSVRRCSLRTGRPREIVQAHFPFARAEGPVARAFAVRYADRR